MNRLPKIVGVQKQSFSRTILHYCFLCAAGAMCWVVQILNYMSSSLVLFMWMEMMLCAMKMTLGHQSIFQRYTRVSVYVHAPISVSTYVWTYAQNLMSVKLCECFITLCCKRKGLI